jgi:hypothetical protein
MATNPSDWQSWWDARHKMTELWHLWSGSLGDEALVRALRRGKVRWRPDSGTDLYSDYDSVRRKVPLKDVLAGLQKLMVFPDEARVEYEHETTDSVSFGTGLLRVSRPRTRKEARTVRIMGPELVWSDLRKDLIEWELPSGVEPSKPHDGRDEADPHPLVPRKRGGRPPMYESKPYVRALLEKARSDPKRGLDWIQRMPPYKRREWLANRAQKAKVQLPGRTTLDAWINEFIADCR